MTVPIPEKPAHVDIKPEWAAWLPTSSGLSTGKPEYTVPAGCPPAKSTVISTTTVTSKIPGTTTIHKSTLFIGAQDAPKTASASGVAGQYGWNGESSSASATVNGAAGSPAGVTGGAPAGITGAPLNGWDNNGNKENKNNGDGNNEVNIGGGGSGGLVFVTDENVFQWQPAQPSNTASGVAPVYTKNADGSYEGTPYGGVGDWQEWGPQSNSTTSNSTSSWPKPGEPGSNVTKPYEHMTDSYCNGPNDRSRWCAGKSVDTNYYTDNFLTRKECHANLVITNGTWNADGKEHMSFLINGQTPGPAIECNWGDIIVVKVTNQLQINGTAIHWHGIRQVGTNDQDGVPGITECSIAPGTTREYRFHASSYGTSWYHSHWGLQFGDGIYGPLIIHGPATANYDVDAGPVMLADTFGSLTAAQQGNIIAHQGPKGTVNYLMNGQNVVADLSSGKHPLWTVQKGKKYLFRIINSAIQNMYTLTIDQHKFEVIAADFVPIVPYTTEFLHIGIGQRYDVIVEMNQAVGSYFFRAITQTQCPSACLNSGLGQANGIIAYEGVATNPYQLPSSTISGNKTAADFATCIDEPITSLVPHVKLSAGTVSAFTASASTLPGGFVNRTDFSDDKGVFRWYLNNGGMNVDFNQPTLKSLSEHKPLNDSVYGNGIVLHGKNKWVYFVIQNQFFAFHPMHLHGHDFSLLGQGDGLFTADKVATLNFDNPPRRDTAMLRGSASPRIPGGYTVIGFETDNPGAWLMHCHIAWHVDGGLALQYIERPEDITYRTTAEFDSECSSYRAFEASTPESRKLSSQSGLRRREPLYFDRIASEQTKNFGDIVRRSNAAAHVVDAHAKRAVGDGAHRRNFGRRR